MSLVKKDDERHFLPFSQNSEHYPDLERTKLDWEFGAEQRYVCWSSEHLVCVYI